MSIINVNLLPLMSCLKFTLAALWQNATRKRLWVDNIAHSRASLFGKRSQRSLFSTLQIGGGLVNAGSPKEGTFCKTKRLVVVDGDGSLWHNKRQPSFQTRPTMRRIWSEMFLKPDNNKVWKLWQLSIIYSYFKKCCRGERRMSIVERRLHDWKECGYWILIRNNLPWCRLHIVPTFDGESYGLSIIFRIQWQRLHFS